MFSSCNVVCARRECEARVSRRLAVLLQHLFGPRYCRACLQLAAPLLYHARPQLNTPEAFTLGGYAVPVSDSISKLRLAH